MSNTFWEYLISDEGQDELFNALPHSETKFLDYYIELEDGGDFSGEKEYEIERVVEVWNENEGGPINKKCICIFSGDRYDCITSVYIYLNDDNQIIATSYLRDFEDDNHKIDSQIVTSIDAIVNEVYDVEEYFFDDQSNWLSEWEENNLIRDYCEYIQEMREDPTGGDGWDD